MSPTRSDGYGNGCLLGEKAIGHGFIQTGGKRRVTKSGKIPSKAKERRKKKRKKIWLTDREDVETKGGGKKKLPVLSMRPAARRA